MDRLRAEFLTTSVSRQRLGPSDDGRSANPCTGDTMALADSATGTRPSASNYPVRVHPCTGQAVEVDLGCWLTRGEQGSVIDEEDAYAPFIVVDRRPRAPRPVGGERAFRPRASPSRSRLAGTLGSASGSRVQKEHDWGEAYLLSTSDWGEL